MSMRERNLRMVFLKAVADAVEAELRRMRDDHTATLLGEWREEGSKSWNVRLPGGTTKVATITLSEPKPSTAVTDPDAFLAWCEANVPGAVEEYETPPVPAVEAVPARTVRRVSPKGQTAILARLKPVGEECVDPESGALVDGVTYKPAAEPKSFSVRYETDGRDALALAYRAGELDHLASGSVLPQIGGRP